MRDRLFILIGSEFPVQVEWLRSSDNAEQHWTMSRSSLADVAKEIAGCQLIVLVPGTEVSLVEAVVPSKQRQHIVSAVPYVLEDQLASDIETLHFALGPRSNNGVVPVVVVAKSRMYEWLEQLRAVSIEPDIMLPDMLALPLLVEEWTVLLDKDNAWVRQGLYSGVVVDSSEIQQWLTLAIDEQGEHHPKIIRCIGRRELEACDIQLSAVDVHIDTEISDDAPLQIFAKNFTDTESINLIQGEYSPREQLGRFLRPWRYTAILFIVVVVFGFGSLVQNYFSLSATSARLASEINQVYLETFPDARKVVDASAQMKQKLIELGAGDVAQGNDFLQLLANVGETVQAVPSVDFRHVSYQGGKLNLSLRIKDLQMLEQLKLALIKNSALEVDIQSAASRDNYVDARLQIGKP